MTLTQKKKSNRQKGQSVVEYIVLVAVIIAVLLVFLGPGGHFRGAYNSTIKTQGDDMLGLVRDIFF